MSVRLRRSTQVVTESTAVEKQVFLELAPAPDTLIRELVSGAGVSGDAKCEVSGFAHERVV